jgi:hypothetical protein
VGEEVHAAGFTREDRRRHRDKLARCLDALELMLAESSFDFERPMTGLEVELNLVGDDYDPAMRNEQVLNAIADPAFQTELGQFNLEINVLPRTLRDDGAVGLERQLRDSLNNADAVASQHGAHIVMIGTLPTLRAEHLSPQAMSRNPRYALLNEQMLAERGEDIDLDIRGPGERLQLHADSILPEAACTSVQFHLQVSPDEFATYWNAAQSVAGVQVALAANSPFLFGQELWRETRIALFEQATDTRSAELRAQGVRPRVWFGERWITSVFDLFTENITFFPPLLPISQDEDPLQMLADGEVPHLGELRLHNGTIWRWNRPVYDVVDGRPHLRVENRVLPSGPTVVDILANGALYFGLVRALVEADRPVWSQLSFSAARENFETAAQHGIDADVFWPGIGEVPVTELVLRHLLPIAQSGLELWSVDGDVIDRLLGVIEGRCLAGQNGATWQVDRVAKAESKGASRQQALQEMTRDYCVLMHANQPVHTWPLD